MPTNNSSYKWVRPAETYKCLCFVWTILWFDIVTALPQSFHLWCRLYFEQQYLLPNDLLHVTVNEPICPSFHHDDSPSHGESKKFPTLPCLSPTKRENLIHFPEISAVFSDSFMLIECSHSDATPLAGPVWKRLCGYYCSPGTFAVLRDPGHSYSERSCPTERSQSHMGKSHVGVVSSR